jgi:hypothetical protein
LLDEAAKALLKNELPSREVRLFLGGALQKWLQHGGSLERDHLKVVKAKSHNTPQAIWRTLHQDEGEPGPNRG